MIQAKQGEDSFDRPIRISLRTSVPILLEVGLRRCDPPPDARLRELVLEWLSGHAAGPIHAVVREFIAGGGLSLSFPALEDFRFRRVIGAHCCRPELAGFLECDRGVRILATDRLARPRAGLWAAIAAAQAISRALDGLPYDPGLRLKFLPLKELHRRGAIDVRQHMAIFHSMNERRIGWFTTLGLPKFGLPNLELQDAPPGLDKELGWLINGIVQHLVNAVLDLADSSLEPPNEILLGPEIRLDGKVMGQPPGSTRLQSSTSTPGSALIRLTYTGRGRGNLEPFIAIGPPRDNRDGQGVWLHQVLKQLRGPERGEDRLQHFEKGAPAMDRAHRRAVARLAEVKVRFARGLRRGEALLVKHGFPWGEDCLEFMWVAVNTWRGMRLQGQLASDPVYRRDLRSGEAIEIDQSEVFDWLILRADGTAEGGYTNFAVPEDAG